MSLRRYRKKRSPDRSKEPRGRVRRGERPRGRGLLFVIQEHHARRLHWDLRLESGGVLKSWAVTRQPSLDQGVRRLAIEVEDHPVEYGSFEGTIPRGEYGAGEVKIWDRGTYESELELGGQIERGVLEFVLRGRRLRGRFVLVRIQGFGEKAHWLFFKAKPKITALKTA